MFLQYILKEKESSLLSQFFTAQMEEPLSGDWWLTVKGDMEDLKLGLSLHDIRSMSKDKLKAIVNAAAEKEAFSWLNEKKQKSEKVKCIYYDKLEIQTYLAKPLLTIHQTKFLFAARSKMLFVRANYPNMQYEQLCPLCTSEVEKAQDTQEHLLNCKILNMNCTEIIQSQIKYEDLFSDNLNKQAKISIILENRFDMRKKLLQDLSHGKKNIATR